MKIGEIRRETAGGLTTATARFEWEDSNREPVDIYFRSGDFSAPQGTDPDGFLTAGFFPAMFHGEKRVFLEGPICPRLRDGLLGAGRLFQLWYGRRPPRVESRRGWQAPPLRLPASSASFLTGGVDSLHSLWKNHQLYPPDHEGRVRECLFVFGLEMPGLEDTPRAKERLELIWPHIAAAAREAKVDVLRVDTNARRLEPDVSFWAWEYIAPPLVASAHLFTSRFSTVILGSSYDFRNLTPWGTHPLLDPLLGSAALSVEHTGAATTRLEKVRELLSWPQALRGLLVCGNSPTFSVNCGKCSKCLRAMVELIAVGAPQPETLPSLETFRSALIDSLEVGPLDVENFWAATIPGLARAGREDLSESVSRYVRRTRAAHRPTGFRKWKRRLLAFDEARLRGLLRRAWRAATRR